MVNSFILAPETIANFQERIENLEKCLNNPNPQDELFAEIMELENSGLISRSQLLEDVIQLRYKVNKFVKLAKALKEKVQLDQLPVILFVRYSFLLKEILDQCSELSFIQHNKTREVFIDMIVAALKKYEIINEVSFLTYPQDEQYILVETLKHVVQSIIKSCLQFNLITEDDEFVKLFQQKYDVISKESEAMLTFLASKKKWDWVYKNLA